MPGEKRRGRWRWRMFSAMLALVYRWSNHREHHHRGALAIRALRMSDQFGTDVAPLVLLALVWLVAGTTQPAHHLTSRP
jgi:hypothetical protein